MQLGWATERASELRVAFRRKGRTELKTKTRLNSTRLFFTRQNMTNRIFMCRTDIHSVDTLLYTLTFVEKCRHPILR